MRYRGLGLSLWNDEAWLADSVLADSLHGMFFYEHWLQVTPPGYLLLLRLVVSLGYPLSNAFLHLLPFAASLVGLLAMWKVSRILFQPYLAPVALFLYALGPFSISYAHTLKQYSAELACAALIMLATVRYLNSASNRT
jgi:hypothetical protein